MFENRITETAPKEALTIKDAAIYTGKSVHTIKSLIRLNKVSHFKEKMIGKNIEVCMIYKDDLDHVYPTVTVRDFGGDNVPRS